MPSIPDVPGVIEPPSLPPSSNSHNNHAVNRNGALKSSGLGSSETGSQSQKIQLSGAEMKRRNKAESKARREKQTREKQQQQQQVRGQDPSTGQQTLGGKQGSHSYGNKTTIMAGEKSQTQSGHDSGRGHPSSSSTTTSSDVREGFKRADSASVVDGHHPRMLAIRGQVKRGSSNLTNGPKETKEVALFGHLYGQSKRTSLAGIGRDVHPTVLALGIQMSNYVICGSNARCVATLFCFKKVRVGTNRYMVL